MKNKLSLNTLTIIILFLTVILCCSCAPSDPYAEGMHWDYKIIHENGFVYKQKDRGVYQIFNSDGTPLRVGKKIY